MHSFLYLRDALIIIDKATIVDKCWYKTLDRIMKDYRGCLNGSQKLWDDDAIHLELKENIMAMNSKRNCFGV